MPIYEYKCSSCGFTKDYILKVSDAPLSVCPECGRDTFSKQLSAPGFQLKGSGWYATDFKGGAKPAAKTDAQPEAGAGTQADAKIDARPDAKTEKPASKSSEDAA